MIDHITNTFPSENLPLIKILVLSRQCLQIICATGFTL